MTDPSPYPPEGLVRSLVDGPSRIAAVEWHAEVASTNALAAQAAATGAPEIHVVGADVQTAGRGRQGRRWSAPAGTSLQTSFLLRPGVPDAALTVLPLVAGVVVAEVTQAHVPGAVVRLKWPNDVLVDGRKAAGILVERIPGGVVVGIGLNTDWRGVERPPELRAAVSLAEVAEHDIDRWKVLAGLAGVLDRRYARWRDDPRGSLDDYRGWCATLGQRVKVTGVDGSERHGHAVGVADDGSLELEVDRRIARVRAGEVTHLRQT
jgi:BirA family transcriptional regulator, biotin operon repressor / biotin---[acetyl-CoA-carboxylase] ligase